MNSGGVGERISACPCERFGGVGGLIERNHRPTMKMSPVFRQVGTAFLCVLAVVSLSQCASTVERRIEKNPALYSALSAQDQQLVRQRQLREGMTKDAVFLAVGRPDRVAAGRKNGKDYERWTYLDTQTVTTQTLGFGMGGWGGWGGGWGGCGPFIDPFFMGGPMVSYIPYEAAWVDFVNGRVSGWQSSPRR
jgi:hypothetical protein